MEENSNAVLAAGRGKVGIKEEKERKRGLVGGVVGEKKRESDCSESPLLCVVPLSGWAVGSARACSSVGEKQVNFQSSPLRAASALASPHSPTDSTARAF